MTGKKILSIVFLMIIFGCGALTLWNGKYELKQIPVEGNYSANRVETVLQENMAGRYGWININGLF